VLSITAPRMRHLEVVRVCTVAFGRWVIWLDTRETAPELSNLVGASMRPALNKQWTRRVVGRSAEFHLLVHLKMIAQRDGTANK
jgi:hypothetical protein